MLLIITTYAYYWRAAQKIGLPAFDDRQRITRFGGALIWLKCVLSPKATSRFLKWLENTVLIAFGRCQPKASLRYVFDDGEFDVVRVMK
jgi:hypothetical protein